MTKQLVVRVWESGQSSPSEVQKQTLASVLEVLNHNYLVLSSYGQTEPDLVIAVPGWPGEWMPSYVLDSDARLVIYPEGHSHLMASPELVSLLDNI